MKKQASGLLLVLACGLLMLGPALLATLGFHGSSAALGSSFTTRLGNMIRHTRDNSSSSSSGSGGSNADVSEVHAMLQSMQQQLEVLKSALPGTIQQELRNFHAGSTSDQRAQQQPLPQQQQQLSQQQESHSISSTQKTAAPHATPPPAPPSKAHYMGQARSGCDPGAAAGIKLELNEHLVAPVVVVAYNRVHYLARSLMHILRHWHADTANQQRFPLFVSVDNGEPSTVQFAAALQFGSQVQVVHNVRDVKRCKPEDGYCNLSVHYHMLLELFFRCLKAPRVIFLEEDLDVAPDFFSYFAAMAPIMQRDTSIMCVSAWNDHGQRGRATNATALFRTDIFPGLGWMLAGDVAAEVIDIWPDVYWDELMRRPDVRKGRQCVFPEVSRTHTFGKEGTSGGAFFETNFRNMLLNGEAVDWGNEDLSYIEEPGFSKHVADWVAAAQPIDRLTTDLRQLCDVSKPDHDENGDLLVQYSSVGDFHLLAEQLSPMMVDCKGGPSQPGNPVRPRASFQGIVSIRCRGRRLFIAPQARSAAEVKPWAEVSAAAAAAATAAASPAAA